MEPQRNMRAPGLRIPPRGGHQRSRVDGASSMTSGREPHWPATLMVLGIVLFVSSFWAVLSTAFIPITEVLRWFALFAFVGNLLPYARTGLRLGMARFQWFMFNLLCVGPVLFCLLFTVDRLFHGPVRIELLDRGMDPVRYWREHGELPHAVPWTEAAQRVPPEEWPFLLKADAIQGRATGLLGHELRMLVSMEDLQVDTLPPQVE